MYKCIKHRIFQTFYYSTNDIIIISSSGNYLPSNIDDCEKGRTEEGRTQQTSTAEQSEPASRSRGEGGKQYKQYQGRMTRLSHEATKIRYV